jgi:predicted aspartyl protease
MYRILRWLVLGMPFLVSACADGGGGGGSCRVATSGDLHVLNAGGSPIVKVTVNSHPVAFIIDTGAVVSSVWPQQVEKLGLQASVAPVRMMGAGGATVGGVAVADQIALGTATASNVAFVTVGEFGDGRTVEGLPVVGLFGGDFLSGYDVDYDLPAGRITLYDRQGCDKDALPTWDGRFYKVKVDHDRIDQTKIIVHLKLNGHPIDAYLDSGASQTLISRDDALAAGVNPSDFAADRKGTAHGIDDSKIVRFLHHFDSLELGPFQFKHPALSVGETGTTLFGAEFFRHHRIWIPRYGDWIYVQPAGVPGQGATTATPSHSPTAATPSQSAASTTGGASQTVK